MDSIAAVGVLAKSQRLRALLPVIMPVLALVGGWVAKSVMGDADTRQKLAVLQVTMESVERKQVELQQSLGAYTVQSQQRIFSIGKQAAYASAAATAGETAKTKATKLADGKAYASRYERIVLAEGKDPQTAFEWLFHDDAQ